MSDIHNKNVDSFSESTSPKNSFRKLGGLLNGPRTFISVVLATLIVVLLAANLFTRGGSTGGNSEVIYSAVSTTTSPQSPGTALVEQAVQLIRNKQYGTALTVLDEAIVADPNYGLIYYNQGVALQFTDKLEDAVSSYTKALSFNNKDANSYYNRGLAQRDLGRLIDAEADLRISSVIKPDWAAAKFNLGQVLMSLGKTVEGEKLITEAKILIPDIGK